MAIKKILLKRGGASENVAHTGEPREVTVDLGAKSLRIHDGATAGGARQAAEAEIPKTLRALGDYDILLRKSHFGKLSLLSDDVGYWTKGALSKVSQLANDVGYKAGHCSYCTHCSYCSNCDRCNQVKCSNVQCSQVQCTQVKCSKCGNCTLCSSE